MVVLTASLLLAGCGSAAPPKSTAAVGRSPTSTSAQEQGVSYARCMRSHHVPNFPDPSGGGGFNLHGSAVDQSSPAVRAAESACESLLPVKHVPTEAPTAAAYRRLLNWAQCMRRHGIAGMPDPKPDPPPGPTASGSQRFDTVMGDGGYWVGIPLSANAHSSAFMQLSTRCGESPTGPVRHRH